ncbi:O-antigen ligase family protein [Vibrio natriegens]|uniref:O-antigen ligase family protein n=1 Tax=Vibrio natriegens TaxID=691 RepID=UPI003909F6D9
MSEIYSLTLICALLLSWVNFSLFLRVSLVMIPFLPRFIGFPLSGGSLSLFRIVVFLSFIRLIYEMLRRERFVLFFSSPIHRNHTILILFYALILFFSSLINGKIIIFQFIDELLTLSFGIVIIYALQTGIVKKDDILASMSLGFFLSLVVAIIEIYAKYPIYSLLGNGDIETTRQLGDVILRDGMYRIYGTLDNPVYYGFYLATMLPICLYHIQAKYKTKFSILFFCITAYVIYNTGSRSSMLLVTLAILLVLSFELYKKQNSTTKILLLMVLSVIVPIALTYIITLVIDMVSSFTSYNDYDSEAVRSLFSRLLQYSKYSTIVENIWFGDGKILSIKNFVAEHGAIDNKMIVILLETGFLGVIIVVFMSVYLVFGLFKYCWLSKLNLLVYTSISLSIIGAIVLPSPISFFYTSILLALIKRPNFT